MEEVSVSQTAARPRHHDWPLRPFVLAGLLGAAGFLFWLVFDQSGNDEPWRMALATLFAVGPLMLAFTFEKDDWREPLVFSAAVGLVMAGIAWRVAAGEDSHADAPFWFFAATVAGVIALPLFQAGFHHLRWRTPYSETHFHVWTDAISVGGALAFTGLSWLLLVLLSELFAAIRITVLKDLMNEGWFGFTFSGAAFGAALGILRNNLAILGTLQRVVMLVFAILAVPLAVALVVFLVAVLLSGMDVLWEATRSATPLLLSAAVGAFVLANAVLRDTDADMSGSRIQRIAAAALALGILPLALLAAVSMGVRIEQHGLSPERLWGLIAIAVAVAYGLGYFVAGIMSRRHGWDRLRQTNLHLAVGTSVLALLLALPLLDFGAISARNQVARLESGAVAPDKFDYAALHWEFGDAGRAALARLAMDPNAEVAKLAKEEQANTERYRPWQSPGAEPAAKRLANLQTDITDPVVRTALEEQIRKQSWRCDDACVAIDLGAVPANPGARAIALVENGYVNTLTVGGKEDDEVNLAISVAEVAGDMETGKQPDQTAKSKVELRSFTSQRVYIDGKPTGPVFPATSTLEAPPPPR